MFLFENTVSEGLGKGGKEDRREKQTGPHLDFSFDEMAIIRSPSLSLR
jgi:hypothetical protein